MSEVITDQLFEELSRASAVVPELSLENIRVNMDSWTRHQLPMQAGMDIAQPDQLMNYGLTMGYMCAVAGAMWSHPSLYNRFSIEDRTAIVAAITIMKNKLKEIKDQKSVFTKVLAMAKEHKSE